MPMLQTKATRRKKSPKSKGKGVVGKKYAVANFAVDALVVLAVVLVKVQQSLRIGRIANLLA